MDQLRRVISVLAIAALSLATRAALADDDTQPPTAPVNLNAWVISESKISLFWHAAEDNVGVTEYLIERCQGSGCSSFTQIDTIDVTYYDDMNLPSGTSFTYRVRAKDAASNLGNYSNLTSGITRDPPDTQAPSEPSNLTATVASATQINLAWAASIDNVGVTAYFVERCEGAGCTDFAPLNTETWTHCADEDEWCSFSGTRTVRYGGGSTWLVQQHTDGVECSNFVFTVPFFGPPKSCEVSSIPPPGPAQTQTFTDIGLTSGVTYRYRVRAQDGAFNQSAYSAIASVSLVYTEFCD